MTTARASARSNSRAATAEAHERLDRIYAGLDLARRADYLTFLSGHAPAFMSIESALVGAGAGRLAPGWPERLRTPGLLQDIATLGLSKPRPAPAQTFINDAQILGGLYVLEGSRLGGAVLIRRVAQGLTTAFLTPGNSADWRALITLIDKTLTSEALQAQAILAAESVFATFEASFNAHRERTAVDT